MNTRPILDSDTGPLVLSTSFNASNTFFSVALDSGFRVFSAATCDQKVAREVGGGIGCAEMLGTTSYIALVGGGKQPKFPQNKVQIWNDHTQRVTTSLEFKTPVQRVRISTTHIIVVLLNKVAVYKMKLPPEKVADYETVNNPFGLCEMSKNIIAFPGRTVGQVKLFDLNTNNVSIFPAHESPLRAVGISKEADLIATASEKGTIIRLWSFPSCTKLAELRRGVDPASILSLGFSPSGSTLAVTSDKSTLHIFDLPAATTSSKSEADANQHKWGMLSKIPLLPRQFSDTYSTATAKFEMGEEPMNWGPQVKSATLSAGIPGVPGGRPTKGLIGWLDEETLLVIGGGHDARWERFTIQVDSGRKVITSKVWKHYLD